MSYAVRPADPYIRLERFDCHARCPAYTIAILGNGGIFFRGHAFVRSLGVYKGWMSRLRRSVLTAAFLQQDFMNLPATISVPARPNCTSVSRLFFRYRGVSHGVILTPMPPGHAVIADLTQLQQLADNIDVLSKSRQWIGEYAEPENNFTRL